MPSTRRAFRLAITCLIAIAALVAPAGRTPSTNAAAPAQDVMSLDRRLSTLEQRLFILESNIGELQQQVQYAQRQPSTSSAVRDPEVERLRLELSQLQGRLAEIECGVLKLDERTLPAATRAARPKPTDPCRSQPNTPVQLSSR